jgi:hypothetical protein
MTYPLIRMINNSGKDIRFTWPKTLNLTGVWTETDLDATKFVLKNTQDWEIKPGLDVLHIPEFKGIIAFQEAASKRATLVEFGVFHTAPNGGFIPDGVSYYFWDNHDNAINGVGNSSPLNVNFWNGGPESLWMVFETDSIPTFKPPSKT